MKNIISISLICLSLAACSGNRNTSRKEASSYTKDKQKSMLESLPLDKAEDFENAKRGFIATSDGNISFPFISNQSAPDTVNPSLWRQSRLNNITGLFEVVPGIYQVRGFDIANITFIKGEKGWILVDTLTTEESAQKAVKLFREHKGDAPITGVIYTHSHMDHFGGIKGALAGQNIEGIKIVAPEHFFEEAVSENLLAGNAMGRRASYMYGGLLPKDEKGMVDAGLGKVISSGTPSILKPNYTIDKDYQKYTIDGVEFEFLMAQNTEAPAEFMFYIPKYKAASSAEVINHTLHNLSTLRGAKTRNTLLWTESIAKTQDFISNRVDVLFGSHHWPTWDQNNIDQLLSKHGDLYRYIHDQTLRLANMGYTVLEIPEMMEIPQSLAGEFYNRGYYGSVSHNAKAVYDFYFGAWWDGNPANLYKHQPEEAAKRYVKFMGGKNKIISMAENSYNEGDYRWVVEVLNHVIFADPSNQRARNISADAMEQLGYQSESAVWRAYYLTGALELRQGVQKDQPALGKVSLDMLDSLPIEEFLKCLSVRLNPEKANNITMKVNLFIGGDAYGLLIQNSVLKFQKSPYRNPSLIIKTERNIFNQALLQAAPKGSINKGLQVSDKEKFQYFIGLFDTFDAWFNIVLP